jgi:hypothetical protein
VQSNKYLSHRRPGAVVATAPHPPIEKIDSSACVASKHQEAKPMRVTIFDDDGGVIFTSDGSSTAFQSANREAIAETLKAAYDSFERRADERDNGLYRGLQGL